MAKLAKEVGVTWKSQDPRKYAQNSSSSPVHGLLERTGAGFNKMA